jgi:hypothetical protein
MSTSWWYVEVTLSLGTSKTQTISGPSRDTEDEAKADLRELQEQLGSGGDWINLDWLSANPKNVIAAHVASGYFGIA